MTQNLENPSLFRAVAPEVPPPEAGTHHPDRRDQYCAKRFRNKTGGSFPGPLLNARFLCKKLAA
ncbi:hypothetical protein TPL01_20420 [Sulfuriferula plumbiphila]|uniref:Uncharacterized protein n=1 Tax=Sulfuriferula plumbiphila TaxID=171865 RepID=A0A512L8U7_9PROT|nr:hypothetical protein [Sulfuriferula plumbiphila]BBP04266.1 hypothetical protein SFPGR_16880 [Sulfuriferula plumbiphila]GEP30904.1 hypothetical protein TPL01_20420 [Sulfuriferula plumbiphila]